MEAARERFFHPPGKSMFDPMAVMGKFLARQKQKIYAPGRLTGQPQQPNITQLETVKSSMP
jgi:hypothetical protein